MATLKDYYNKVPSTLLSDIRKYQINNFIETGTGLGDTVAYVLNQNSGVQITSIEFHPEVARRAQDRFIYEDKVLILEGDSKEVLKDLKTNYYTGNTLFFLDAHYPGADFGYSKYNDPDMDPDLKLPLHKELEVICNIKDVSQDVFLIDDLRIYEEGPYEMGNITKEQGAVLTGVDFIYDLLGKTHNIEKHYFYTGFLTITPKNGN